MTDDDRLRIDATKRQLVERAVKLLGREQLARRLNVASTLVESWVSGDAILPDGKLRELARVLDSASRESRWSSGQ
jgi:hypothetical protein